MGLNPVAVRDRSPRRLGQSVKWMKASGCRGHGAAASGMGEGEGEARPQGAMVSSKKAKEARAPSTMGTNPQTRGVNEAHYQSSKTVWSLSVKSAVTE